MKRSRFSEEQIIGILRQAEAGMRVVDLCRRHGISDATFCKWRARYGGMDVSDAMRLRRLEEESARLGKMAPSRRWTFPSSRMSCQKTSEARVMQRGRAVCPDGIHGLPAAGLRDTGRQPRHCAASSSTEPGWHLRRRLRELAEERRRFGVQRLKFLVNSQFLQQVAAKLPWGHIMALINRLKTENERLRYGLQTVGWSRAF